MKKIILASVVASSVLMAGGYKIPEASLNAVALSAANVAHSIGADAAYFNPANMVFMKDEHAMELALTYIGLSEVEYKGDTYARKKDGSVLSITPTDTASEKESFIIPSFHYVSPKIGNARFGFSMVTPGGLSKRWEDKTPASKAKEFTLQTVEMSPTIALPIGDKVAIAAGIRMVYSHGIVTAESAGMFSQEMTGDSIDFGYNLALSYKPTSDMDVALTYRSKIDLTQTGDADVYASAGFLTAIGSSAAYAIDPKKNVEASVSVPLPAALNIAFAYTLPTDTTVEFVYERTFWSAYEELNFNFSDPKAEGIFGKSKSKAWNDTSAFRLGITQPLGDATLMAGVVIDESPVPDETVGFELPDSDSVSVSFGARYAINSSVDVGLAALYSMREDRTVSNADLVGEFTNSNALLISAGVGYRF